MTMVEKLEWLSLGIVIGYLLNYIAPIQVKRKVGAMHEPLKDRFKRVDWSKLALLIVVLITALSAFRSQQVSNAIEQADKRDNARQEQVRKITECNSEFLGKTILALNDRTTYSTLQASSNVELQRSQLRYLTFALSIPPPAPEDGRKAVSQYLQKLRDYLTVSTKTAGQVANNAYPTVADFNNCVVSKD